MERDLAQARQVVARRDWLTPTLRRVWTELLLGQLVVWAAFAGVAAAAVALFPDLLRRSVAVEMRRANAALPEDWPLDEVVLPPGAVPAELPAAYWKTGPRYVIGGERWADPQNYGKFPELWMVAFTCPRAPAQAYNHMLAGLHEPLYKLLDASHNASEAQHAFVYCDGDTLVYINGPHPDAAAQPDAYYTLRILVYDH